MTKRTATKLGRQYAVELFGGQPMITKRKEALPPNPRRQLVFCINDMVCAETVSDGQQINQRKAYLRHMEKGSAISVHEFTRLLSNLFEQTVVADGECNLILEDDTKIPAAEWVGGVSVEVFEKYGLMTAERRKEVEAEKAATETSKEDPNAEGKESTDTPDSV